MQRQPAHAALPAMSLLFLLTWLSSMVIEARIARAQAPSAADRSESPARGSGRIVAIEGAFGKAELDRSAPALDRLYLRGPDGLTAQSLLATQGPPHGPRSQPRPWVRGAYTYVVGEDGTRYESRHSAPEKVETFVRHGASVVRLLGVQLRAEGGGPSVATETWTLSAPTDQPELSWTVSRRWNGDFAGQLAGSPALFFTFNAREVPNSVTSTIWYDPLWLAAQSSPLYLQKARLPGVISANQLQTIRDRDAWAIYKLWTGWHCPVDLRLEVAGGHLYRRGGIAWLGEAGAVSQVTTPYRSRAGTVEELTLRIRPVEKQATGYQLRVSLPDKATQSALADFYGSLFNGGAVNDQKGYDFGNETDGWYYAGSSWMYGAALAAGVPANGALSSRPFDAAGAFREHLCHIVSVLDEQGRAHFGYNHSGHWVDDNLHTIQGVCWYLVHSGDRNTVRQLLPALERMLDYFVRHRNVEGLFELEPGGVGRLAGCHWYYDAIQAGSLNAYHNAFFYKAACDLAEMEAAAGRTDQAAQYRKLAESLCAAFNRVFWKADLPGGPRYIDFFDRQGQPVSYFCDLCQWPAVAFGIASAAQARKIVTTADARIRTLEKEYGYQGFAGLAALWPVPEPLNTARRPFGRYMNGGSLLAQTYWEIVGRARAGDAEGAARRLKLFARRAREISWAGDNAADILGEMRGGDGEPYLADMVAVTAAAIHGVLGIRPTWERLEVAPRLPADWPHAQAEILYKGRRHRITIDGGKVQIEPLEQVLTPPLVWLMDFNLRSTHQDAAIVSDVEFLGHYGDSIALKKLPVATPPARYAPKGTYQSPAWDWTVPARLSTLEVAAELRGGSIRAVVETSADGFRSIGRRLELAVGEGVTTHSLAGLRDPAPGVRVRFEFMAGDDRTTSPLVDAFRIVGREIGSR